MWVMFYRFFGIFVIYQGGFFIILVRNRSNSGAKFPGFSGTDCEDGTQMYNSMESTIVQGPESVHFFVITVNPTSTSPVDKMDSIVHSYYPGQKFSGRTFLKMQSAPRVTLYNFHQAGFSLYALHKDDIDYLSKQ